MRAVFNAHHTRLSNTVAEKKILQVAYAWLHGETSSTGALAEDNLVTQAIRTVSVCADSMSSQVHLGVIQALLTIAMSEYFIVHGEALVHCLKIIFNLAIATEDKMISLTAHNALLQVCQSRSPLQSTLQEPVCVGLAVVPPLQGVMPGIAVLMKTQNQAFVHVSIVMQICNTVVRHTVRSTAFPLYQGQDLSPNAQASARHSTATKTAFPAPADSLPQPPSSPLRAAPSNEAALASFTPRDYNTSATTRTAQLFALAEQCDLQGLEAAFEGIPAGSSPGAHSNGAARVTTLSRSSSAPRNLPQATFSGAGATAAVVELSKGRSSSTELTETAAAHRTDSTGDLARAASLGAQPSVKRRASLRSLASSKSGYNARPRVDVLEADLIMVLTALCRLASRRMSGSESDVYIAAGRHLASDILLKVRRYHSYACGMPVKHMSLHVRCGIL